MHIRTALLPVAGSIRDNVGTEPGSSDSSASVMRTVVDKPIVELAMEEALRAGAERLVFVTAPAAHHLESDIQSIAGKLRHQDFGDFEIVFVRQEERRGLGHALLTARPTLENEIFAVLIPNLLVIGEDAGLQRLAKAYEPGSIVIGSTERPSEKLRNFGVLEFDGEDSPRVSFVHEKPDGFEDRFSRASFGRWVFGPEIWDGLQQAEAESSSEISLTAAINNRISHEQVTAVPVGGLCFDLRHADGFVQATLAYAMRRPDLAEAVLDAQRDILDFGVKTLRARAWTQRYTSLTTLALLAQLIEKDFSGRIALVSSFGADSNVLLHLISRVSKETPVLFLETGKLFSETLSYQAELAERLGLRNVRFARPDPQRLRALDKDGNLHKENPDMCCQIRKAEPLKAALEDFDCWITGRKRYQSATRQDLELFEEEEGGRLKVNPLFSWSKEQLRKYVLDYDLPPHPLVAQGYPSIGCAPCTSPVRDGESERAGRWRGREKTECGIHFVNGRLVRQDG